MHIDEGKLRAYLDQALPPDELDTIRKHLAHSPEARARLAGLRRERDQTAQRLAVLAPPPAAYSPASQALHRLRTFVVNKPAWSMDKASVEIKERIGTMLKKSFIKRYQPAFVALIVVAIAAVLLSFAPVRAIAGNLLRSFRVQEVKVIPVDVAHLENMENNEELNGLLDQLDPGAEVVSGGGDPQEVDSLEEAAKMVDFTVAEIDKLPDDVGELNEVLVHEKTVYNLNLDKDLLESIFEAAEIEISLPDSLNETPIVVTRPAGIGQQWVSDENPTLHFAQLGSPEIDYPDDLNLNELGVAALQFLGKSKEEAEELGATIDWPSTLLLPVPGDADVTTSEVSINGAKGVLFTESDSGDASAMWQKNGVTYLLGGNYSADQISEIARSVK